MFGFKSKKVKALEKTIDMLNNDLMSLQEEYDRFKITTAMDEIAKRKVVTLRMGVTVDTYYGRDEAIEYGKKVLLKKLADSISKHVSFNICEGEDTVYGRKVDIVGIIDVLENSIAERRLIKDFRMVKEGYYHAGDHQTAADGSDRQGNQKDGKDGCF